MATGVVKWFNTVKGYGFITPDEGGKDVFVHITAVNASGLDGLNEGQKVSYETEEDRKGEVETPWSEQSGDDPSSEDRQRRQDERERTRGKRASCHTDPRGCGGTVGDFDEPESIVSPRHRTHQPGNDKDDSEV